MPGGYIIIINPAFKCLFRDNDKICYGVRRYYAGQVKNMLLDAGFTPVIGTYFNAVSFFPLLTVTLLQRLGIARTENPAAELKLLPGFINEALKSIMTLERVCIRIFGKMPFGSSLLSVGRKMT